MNGHEMQVRRNNLFTGHAARYLLPGSQGGFENSFRERWSAVPALRREVVVSIPPTLSNTAFEAGHASTALHLRAHPAL